MRQLITIFCIALLSVVQGDMVRIFGGGAAINLTQK